MNGKSKLTTWAEIAQIVSVIGILIGLLALLKQFDVLPASLPVPEFRTLAILFGIVMALVVLLLAFSSRAAAHTHGVVAPIAQRDVERIRAQHELTRLREIGVVILLNRPCRTDEDVKDLTRDIDVWDGVVADAMIDAAVSDSDIASFRVLGAFENYGLAGLNEEHEQIRNVLTEKLRRLERVIGSLSVRSNQ